MLLTPSGTDNDAVRELLKELKDLNKTIKRANIVNGRMTVLLFIVAFCQLFIGAYQLSVMLGGTGPKAAYISIFITVLIGGLMLYFLNDYIKSEKAMGHLGRSSKKIK